MSSTILREVVERNTQIMYYVEFKLVEHLSEQLAEAMEPTVRQAFALHQQQTQGQLRRLEQVFDLLECAPQTEVSEGIEGLLEEKQSFASEAPCAQAVDLCNVLLAQKIEHYEISGYTGLIAGLQQLGLNQAADLLSQSLQEEEATLQTLIGFVPWLMQAADTPPPTQPTAE